LYVILIAVQKTIIMETIQHIQKKRTDNLPALFFVLRVALGFSGLLLIYQRNFIYA